MGLLPARSERMAEDARLGGPRKHPAVLAVDRTYLSFTIFPYDYDPSPYGIIRYLFLSCQEVVVLINILYDSG